MKPETYPEMLLEHAALLIARRRPSAADLRRSCSASYYALFHFFIGEAAKLFPASGRSYIRRCFHHGEMSKTARVFSSNQQIVIDTLKGPGQQPTHLTHVAHRQNKQVAVAPKLKDVARSFVEAQELRENADYDLAHAITKTEADMAHRRVIQTIEDWKAVRKTRAAKLFLIACMGMKRQGS